MQWSLLADPRVLYKYLLLKFLHCPDDVDRYYLYCSAARDSVLNVTWKINFREKDEAVYWILLLYSLIVFPLGRKEGAKKFPSALVVLLQFQLSVN